MTKNGNGAYVEHSQFPSFIKELKIDNFFDIFTGPLIAAGDDNLATQPTLIMTNDGLIVSVYKYNLKEDDESTDDNIKCEIIDILDGSGGKIDLDNNNADISELVYADFSNDFFTEKYGYLLKKENISIDGERILWFKNKKIYGKGGVTYFTCDGDSEAPVDEYGDYRLSDSAFKEIEMTNFVYLSKKMNYKISDHDKYEISLINTDGSEEKLTVDSNGIFMIPRYSTLIGNPGKCFKIKIKLVDGAEISDIRIR